MQGCFDLAARRQAGEKIINFLIAATVKTENDGITGPKGVAHHIGAHQHHGAIARQAAVEDIGSCLGWHLGCHRRFGDFLEVEIAAETFLVEGQSFTALAVEIQVGIHLCHVSKLVELFGAEDVQFCQLKGLFATNFGVTFIR